MSPETAVRIGGRCAIGAAATFVVLLVYLYGFLSRQGFQPEMFDDHTLLHPWVADHPNAYRATWLLAGLTQLLLLPVPLAVAWSAAGGVPAKQDGPVGTRPPGTRPPGSLAIWSLPFAYIAIGLGLAGAAVFYATNNSLAFAYVSSSGEVGRQQVLVASTAFADVAKEFRLFGQMALAVWLVAVGKVISMNGRDRMGRLVMAGGVATAMVIGHKLWFPDSPLEEFWALGLAALYFVIGLHLLRVDVS